MTNEIANEIELLGKCLAGSNNAFGGIVARYQSLVCAITYSATGDTAASEDMAQEVFVNAWKNLAQLKDLSKFRAWLCGIARNVILNHLRDKKRNVAVRGVPMGSFDSISHEGSDPADRMISKEQEAVVREALQKIPEEYREPLVLFYREEQSVREVAAQLELSEEAVRTRLSRARLMLKNEVEMMIEKTIGRSRPGKAFTTAVMAGIAGIGVGASGAAAAGVVITGSGTGTGAATAAAGGSAILAGLTAKILTAAAVIAIGVGAVVTYKQISDSSPNPDSHKVITMSQKQKKDSKKLTAENFKDKTSYSSASAAINSTLDKTGVDGVSATKSANAQPFEFVASGALSGLITDVNTSEPIKDVEVRIYCYANEEQHQTKSDANGMYCFKNIEKDCSYAITLETNDYITREDWQNQREYVQLTRGTKFVKHFQLEKGGRIDIRVADEYGNPVKTVGFYAAYVSDEMGRGPKRMVHSDKQGNAAIGGLKPAEYMVTAMHKDYAPVGQKVVLEEAHQIKAIVCEMKAGVSVTGKAVCSDGLPAGGWEIYAKPVWWHSMYCAYDYPIEEAGNFVLQHILPGDHLVGINVPQGDGSTGLWSTRMTLPPENGFLTFNIPKPSPKIRVSISGTIKFVGGESGRGVWVTARDDSDNWGSIHVPKGKTEFTIENLVPGLYNVDFDVMAGDAEKAIFRNIKAPSAGNIFEIRMKKLANSMLRGKVVDKGTGSPVTKFQLRFVGDQWREVNNPEGKFEVQSTSGEKQIQIKADGYALKTCEPVSADANHVPVIKLGIGGAIEGTIVDENRKAIQGAKISYRYPQRRNEEPNEKYITVTDANGQFYIEDIVADSASQWFVISHHDYAPEIKLIKINEDCITNIEIMLKKGGIVEGYVYDEKGNPLSNVNLHFLDESHYGYWKENRGRLGSAVTDSSGFYRINGLPEKLCYGFKSEPDKQLGTVCTSVLPKNGKTTHLDFGGQWHTTGRLLKDDKPMANIKVTVRGNIAGWETAFIAYALTDSEGKFTFWGIPSGRRYVYWFTPEGRNWNGWIEIGRFDFKSGVDLNLGDFKINLAEVTISAIAEDTKEPLNDLDVSIERYDEKMFGSGQRIGKLLPRTDTNDPFIFSNLSVGTYEAIASRRNYPAIRKVFEIKKDQANNDVDLMIPNGTSGLSGKITYSDSKYAGTPLMLRNINQTLTMYIEPAADGSYKIGNLPASDYIIGRTSVALSRQSKLKEFSLNAAEHLNLDIEVDDRDREVSGYIVVLIVTEDGLPLAGTKAWLEKDGTSINPHFDADNSKSFSGDPGEWTFCAEVSGYKSVSQKVTMKSTKGRNTEEILKPVIITMEKE